MYFFIKYVFLLYNILNYVSGSYLFLRVLQIECRETIYIRGYKIYLYKEVMCDTWYFVFAGIEFCVS